MNSVQHWTGREARVLRLAMRLSVRAFADHLGVGQRTVSKWEAMGASIVPRPHMQAVLDTALDQADPRARLRFEQVLAELTDAQGRRQGQNNPRTWTGLGASNSFPSIPLGPGSRGQLCPGLNPTDHLTSIAVETPAPTRIGWSDVEHIRAATRAVAMSENLFGGGLSCEAALAQLRWAGKLLDAGGMDDVRRSMHEAVGNLASVVAFSAFDIAAHRAADQCFSFALWCAEQSGSWALRANTLAEMSRKAVYLGEVNEALSLVENAQVRADRLSATAQAMLSALRARLLALTVRYDEARGEVERADSHFAERNPATDPPWLCYYDEAEHQGSTARALIPVARTTGEPNLAAARLETAIRLHEAHYPRSRTFSCTRLASLLMDTGYSTEAIPVARQAVADAVPLRSQRLAKELRGLARAAERHARSSDVQQLRHDIAALPVAAMAEVRQT